jgi:SAM-dependent methyltransferase
LTKSIADPPAPAIFDPALAPRAGRRLSEIVAVRPQFLSLFESPRFGQTEFTRGAFERELGDHLDEREDDATFTVFLDSGIIKRVPGVSGDGVELFAPTCRINQSVVREGGFEQRVFVCTDSPVVDFDARVFPWADEGEAIFALITEACRGRAVRGVLDICSGAGTAGLLLSKLWPDAQVVGVDNSRRAIGYASFNALLNDARNYTAICHDLTDGRALKDVLVPDGFDVVIVDPPFTAMPPGISGYAHSSRTHVVTESLREGLAQVRVGGALLMLCYSFGSADSPVQLHNLLDSLDLSGFWTPSIEHLHHPMWRLNGEKNNPLNPMPVQYMAPRYNDPDWHPKFVANNYTYADYVMWIENSFARKGLTHLHYLSVLFRKTERA